MKEIKAGTTKIVNMREIVEKAKFNSRTKPIFDIKLSHCAEWRLNTDETNKIKKLNVIYAFLKVKEQI